MSGQGSGDPAFPRKMIVAAVLESVVILAGMVAFLLTEEVFWIIGAAVVGSLGMGFWLLDQTRKRPSASSIVEVGDRR